MPRLQRQPDGSRISYESTGDGFPLVLLPGAEGMADWLPHIELFGELCHAIAYEECQPQPVAETLPALLDGLRVERAYLASPVPAWLPALEFACRRPEALEALLLVDFPGSAVEAPLPGPALCARLSDMTLPTLILLTDETGPARGAATRISTHLPHCRTVAVGRPGQGEAGLPDSPRRRFPHLMMRFLLDRERHRNLVRGASFLL